MAYIPKNKRYPTYPGMYEGITSDQFAANEGRGSAGGETKSKAKTVISKTFDQSGQTDLKVDTDDAGIVTTTKQVTPTAVLDAMVELESYESLGLFPSESIATLPVDVVEEEVDDEEFGEIITAPGGQQMVWSYRENGYIPYDDYLEGTKQFPQYTDLSMYDMSMADGPESRLSRAKITGTNDPEEEVNVSNVVSSYQEGTKEDYLAWSAQSAFNHLVNEEAEMSGDYTYRPDPHSGDYDEMLEDDSEVFDNIDEATGGDGVVSDIVIDALKTIKETDPTGQGIETINAFADWADTHTDQEAEREAEIYLQSLKDSPSVDSKFRKAMAIALMAMLFGDDFSTAMNTGFGVVADDYAAEALAAKTQAEANAALAKEMAKEQRKFAYETLGSERDFAEQVALKSMEQSASSAKETKTAEAKRLKDNVELGAKVLSEMIESVKGLPAYELSGLAGQSVTQQMSGFMDEIESSSPDGFKLDLYNNKQMYAMSGALENFIHQSLHYDKLGAPDAKSYASEMFTKLEVEKYTDISPNIISPSASYLNGADTGQANQVRLTKIKGEETAPTHYVDPKVLRNKYQGTRNGHKQTIRLGETITALAELKSTGGNTMGEQTALILLKKDYDDYLKYQPESFRRNERMAYSAGVGPFTRFVLTELAGKTNDTIGINFDTVLQQSSITDRNTVLSSYIKTKSKIKT